MKAKILYLAAIATGVALSACKREDDTPTTPSNEEQLSGVWYLTDISANGTFSLAGTTIPFVSTGSDVDSASYFDFTHTPSQTVDYDAAADVDITAGGTDITIPYQRSGTGTWELKGRDSIIVTETSGVTRYGILKWTDTQMILRSRQNITFQGQNVLANFEAIIER